MCEHYPYFAAYSWIPKVLGPPMEYSGFLRSLWKYDARLHTTNKQWLSYFTTSPRLTAKNALKRFNLYKREAICKKSSCSGNFIGHLFPNSFWFLSWKKHNHDWALKVSCEQVGWLAGWCKGWCEVKVEQLCIIYPASQFSSIHPGLSLYKKKTCWCIFSQMGSTGQNRKMIYWHCSNLMILVASAGRTLMRMTKVYQNAWKAKETASIYDHVDYTIRRTTLTESLMRLSEGVREWHGTSPGGTIGGTTAVHWWPDWCIRSKWSKLCRQWKWAWWRVVSIVIFTLQPEADNDDENNWPLPEASKGFKKV